MTTRTPLPPLPSPAALARTTHPALAAITPRLLGPQPAGRMYEDSPYTAVNHTPDPEPAPDDEDDKPWCAVPRP